MDAFRPKPLSGTYPLSKTHGSCFLNRWPQGVRKGSDTAAEMDLNVADRAPRGPVFRPHDGARLACGPSVGEKPEATQRLEVEKIREILETENPTGTKGDVTGRFQEQAQRHYKRRDQM